MKILDDDLSGAAYAAQTFDKPFNQTLAQAKLLGAAIGCDFFLLVKTQTYKRQSAAGDGVYESSAAIFAASARTGRLVYFKVESRDAYAESEAREKLYDAANALAAEIAARLRTIQIEERNEKPANPNFQPPPEDDAPEAKNFRPPLPYKRLSPIYTRLANFYAVEATVDALCDVDENGKIVNIEIARWAGFGLDESVAENVRRMNWRAADVTGKSVKARVLLRYNFKKIETAK